MREPVGSLERGLAMIGSIEPPATLPRRSASRERSTTEACSISERIEWADGIQSSPTPWRLHFAAELLRELAERPGTPHTLEMSSLPRRPPVWSTGAVSVVCSDSICPTHTGALPETIEFGRTDLCWLLEHQAIGGSRSAPEAAEVESAPGGACDSDAPTGHDPISPSTTAQYAAAMYRNLVVPPKRIV